MKKIAIITAGGIGTRMGSIIPKQFLLLRGKPVLWHTFSAFLSAYIDIEFILVVPADYMNEASQLVEELQITHQVKMVIGGATRFHSVQNGLSHINESSIIFVHDGVRCLVSPDLIKRCYDQAIVLGSAVPAVSSTDSVRIETVQGHQPIDRSKVKIIQTPQTFNSQFILPAFDQPYQESFTDEASVVENMGYSVHLIEGEYENIKITRPSDLQLAEKVLEDRGLVI